MAERNPLDVEVISATFQNELRRFVNVLNIEDF